MYTDDGSKPGSAASYVRSTMQIAGQVKDSSGYLQSDCVQEKCLDSNPYAQSITYANHINERGI